MSNSNNMTFEEKVTQKLKEETLFQLMGDEDALTDKIRDYLDKIMFEKTGFVDDVENSSKWDSKQIWDNGPIGTMALHIVETQLKDVVENIINDAKVEHLIANFIASAIPQVIFNALTNTVNSGYISNLSSSMSQLDYNLRNGLESHFDSHYDHKISYPQIDKSLHDQLENFFRNEGHRINKAKIKPWIKSEDDIKTFLNLPISIVKKWVEDIEEKAENIAKRYELKDYLKSYSYDFLNLEDCIISYSLGDDSKYPNKERLKEASAEVEQLYKDNHITKWISERLKDDN